MNNTILIGLGINYTLMVVSAFLDIYDSTVLAGVGFLGVLILGCSIEITDSISELNKNITNGK